MRVRATKLVGKSLSAPHLDGNCYISHPEIIFEGKECELLAVRETQLGKWLVVAYRELAEDGFIITAFFTRRRQYLIKRKQLWP